MHDSQSRRSERHTGLFLDVAHLVLGTGIVVLAVLSFINPEGNQMLFPLVFLLAALLSGLSCVFEFKTRERGKKRLGRGIFRLVLTLLLTGLGVLSAISIWL